MLKAGRYTTKGGYQVRIDKDIAAHGLGVAWKGEETRYVCYLANGEFAFKNEDYGEYGNPGDSLDIVLEASE